MDLKAWFTYKIYYLEITLLSCTIIYVYSCSEMFISISDLLNNFVVQCIIVMSRNKHLLGCNRVGTVIKVKELGLFNPLSWVLPAIIPWHKSNTKSSECLCVLSNYTIKICFDSLLKFSTFPIFFSFFSEYFQDNFQYKGYAFDLF